MELNRRQHLAHLLDSSGSMSPSQMGMATVFLGAVVAAATAFAAITVLSLVECYRRRERHLLGVRCRLSGGISPADLAHTSARAATGRHLDLPSALSYLRPWYRRSIVSAAHLPDVHGGNVLWRNRRTGAPLSLQKRPLRGQSRPVYTSGAERSPLHDLGLAVINGLGCAGIGPDAPVRACSPTGELQLNPHDHLVGGRYRCDGRLRRYDNSAVSSAD